MIRNHDVAAAATAHINQHCKKYRGRVTRVTNQKVSTSPPAHTFSVSSGNVLVAFGSVW